MSAGRRLAAAVSVAALTACGPLAPPRRVAGSGPMDANGDGRVSLAEYQRSLRPFFDAIDRDGDGRYSGIERRLTPLPPTLAAQLRAADADRDGDVVLAEYQAEISRRFADVDIDHDGALTPAEFALANRRARASAGSAPAAP